MFRKRNIHEKPVILEKSESCEEHVDEDLEDVLLIQSARDLKRMKRGVSGAAKELSQPVAAVVALPNKEKWGLCMDNVLEITTSGARIQRNNNTLTDEDTALQVFINEGLKIKGLLDASPEKPQADISHAEIISEVQLNEQPDESRYDTVNWTTGLQETRLQDSRTLENVVEMEKLLRKQMLGTDKSAAPKPRADRRTELIHWKPTIDEEDPKSAYDIICAGRSAEDIETLRRKMRHY